MLKSITRSTKQTKANMKIDLKIVKFGASRIEGNTNFKISWKRGPQTETTIPFMLRPDELVQEIAVPMSKESGFYYNQEGIWQLKDC